ncbi:CDP-glycerol glycerophosphotransferase family protein [Microbacterium sp. 2FI]|uniref:CDP-glycerol glycerophosphotransferase family protein n=1 Tax=Microbacterium sp. 2FI TaxID=2502193 RepID=UPI0010F5B0C9|nr:CDP-glycerol glycerophosphotransferase family protein [Microbacterium sp. 2FI]
MASFSFGAGNARKLATIPLYAVGRLATLLIPRSHGEWVFGCGAGIGDGALALWRAAAADRQRAVWLVSSAREARDAAALGIPSIPKRSIRGFWRTARARVIVVTHGFGDVNRYAVSGGFVVQLWHGIPLKRIGLDSPATLRLPRGLARLRGLAFVSRLLAAMYRGAAQRIHILPAASHLVRGRLESAFGLPGSRVPVTGDPRVDVLSRGSATERRSLARAAIDAACARLDPGARLVLYAPTWRDGAPDPAVPTPEEWREIVEVLTRNDAVMLVRSHPLGAGEYVPPFPTDRVQALGSDLVADVTPLLPGVDALVTDYSSLIFDAALVPLPVVLLAPDVEAYARDRGFYGTYRDVGGDDAARQWSDAAIQLGGVLGDSAEHERRVEISRAISERVHAYRDGGNTARVYRSILAGSGLHPTKGNR